MFITLKCPSGHGDNEMEQVASRGASNSPAGDRNRVRLGRRPACLSCQTKKLRCTGRTGDCDGCRARSISCVFPSNSANQRPNHDSHWAFQGNSQQKNRSRLPVVPAESELLPPALATSPSELTAASTSAPSQNDDPQEGDMFEIDFDLEMSHVMLDIEELSRNNPELNANDIVGVMDPRNNDSYNPEALQYALTMQKSPLSLPLSLSTPTLQNPLSVGPLGVFNESLAQQNIQQAAIGNGLDENNRNQSDSAANSHVNQGNGIKADSCNCMHSTVRVVQQLDDDDFRITSLTLSQVLQLQKAIIAKCYKPLDCPNCKYLSTVHTILVIVCSRLAEMFECIHKRIKKANQRMTGQSESRNQSPTSEPPAVSEGGEQLFCTSYHCPAGKANCNPGLFPSEFQAMYSNEEQVHMIRVLLKLQVRNFRTLLSRIRDTSQFAGSEARQTKIESLNTRLVRAAGDIDKALRAALQFFAVGQSIQ